MRTHAEGLRGADTPEVSAHEEELNRLVLAGRLVDAFDAFCDEEVTMQENDGPLTAGFAANRAREVAFMESVASFDEIRLLAWAVHGDVSFSEWLMDMSLVSGARLRLEQVAVRRWRDGKVISERFYYRPTTG